jgi:hypothetical protein
VAVRRGCLDRLSSEGGLSVMDRKTLIIILVVLAVIAAGLWAWRLRSTQYPKEYTGEQPAGPGAPMKMDRPMGVGGQGGQQPQQPQAPVQSF